MVKSREIAPCWAWALGIASLRQDKKRPGDRNREEARAGVVGSNCIHGLWFEEIECYGFTVRAMRKPKIWKALFGSSYPRWLVRELMAGVVQLPPRKIRAAMVSGPGP